VRLEQPHERAARTRVIFTGLGFQCGLGVENLCFVTAFFGKTEKYAEECGGENFRGVVGGRRTEPRIGE
jgi:hypothetical protein